MPSATLSLGGVLVGVGLTGYFGSGRASPTALIPAFVGAPLAALGGIASRARRRRPRRAALAGAAAVSALGLAGAAPGLLKLPSLARGRAQRPAAVISQSVMAALCAASALVAGLSLARH